MTVPFARPAPTDHPIHELFANRWSARAIDTEKPVERESLLSMLEAARWAPSCFGDQPWRYIVFDRHHDAEAWEAAADCMAEGNQKWARSAPVLLAALADSAFTRNDKPNRWGPYDTGAATLSLHVQGVALGLVVHQMGGFSGSALAEKFGIPERYQPMAMIAVGHPGELDDLHEDYQGSELGKRQRRPLSELAFEGRWGGELGG